jgi:hypothetical protein
MAQDAVATLEATRKKLIDKLLKKRGEIDEQLKGLGYQGEIALKVSSRAT